MFRAMDYERADFEEIGLGEDPSTRLLGEMLLNGVMFHVEAVAVRNVEHNDGADSWAEYEAVEAEDSEIVDRIERGDPEVQLQVVRIPGCDHDYLVSVLPYGK